MAEGASVLQAVAEIKNEISPALKEIAKDLQSTAQDFDKFNDTLMAKFKNIGTSLEKVSGFKDLDKQAKDAIENIKNNIDILSDRIDKLKSKKPFEVGDVNVIQNTIELYDKMVTKEREKLDLLAKQLELQERDRQIAGSTREQQSKISDAKKKSLSVDEQRAKISDELAQKHRLQIESEQRAYELAQQRASLKQSEIQQEQALLQLKSQQRIYEGGKTPQGALDMAQQARTLNEMSEAMKAIDMARKSVAAGSPELTRLNQEYERLNKNMQIARTQGIETSKTMNQLSRSFENLVYRVAFYGSLGMITRFIKGIAQTRGEYEQLEKSLGGIIGNMQEAHAVLEKQRDLAFFSPFAVRQLQEANKQLAAFGYTAQEIVPITMKIGDIAAGIGMEMSKLISIIGRVKGTGILDTRGLKSLASEGLNVAAMLAKVYSELEGRTVTIRDVYQRAASGMVTYSDVIKVVNKYTEEGGMFFEAQAKAADTLKGQLTNLGDAYRNMLQGLGESNEGVIKGAVIGVRELIENWQTIAEVIKYVALTFGIYKAGQLLLNKTIGETLLMGRARIENERIISNLEQRRIAALTLLTKAERDALLIKRESSVETYKNMIREGALTERQIALRLSFAKIFGLERANLRQAAIEQGVFNKAQLDGITRTTFARIAFISLGTAIGQAALQLAKFTAAALLNPYTWIMVAVGAIFRYNQKVKETQRLHEELNQSVRDYAKNVEKSFESIGISLKKGIEENTETALKDLREQIESEFADKPIILNLAFEGLTDTMSSVLQMTKIQENLIGIKKGLEDATLATETFKNAFDDTKVQKRAKQLSDAMSNLNREINKISDGELRKEAQLIYEELSKANISSVKFRENLERLKGLQIYTKTGLLGLNVEGELFRFEKEFTKLISILKQHHKFDIDFKTADAEQKAFIATLVEKTLPQLEKAGIKGRELLQQWFSGTFYIDIEPRIKHITTSAFEDEIRKLASRTRIVYEKEMDKLEKREEVFLPYSTIISEEDLQQLTNWSKLYDHLKSKEEELTKVRENAINSKDKDAKAIVDLTDAQLEYIKTIKEGKDITFPIKDKAGKDLEKERINSIIKSLEEAQIAYKNFYNLTSDGAKTQEHILRSLGSEWKNLGISLEELSKVAPSKQAGIDFLESLKSGLKSPAAIKSLEHAIGKLKVEIELEFEQRAINEFKAELERITEGYKVHLEFEKIEDTEIRDYIRSLSQDLGIKIGLELDYDTTISRLENLIKNLSVQPEFEQFKAEQLEISPTMDIKDIESAWNDLLVFWSKSEEERARISAEASQKIIEIQKGRVADFQKIMEQYIAASRSKESEILELERQNVRDRLTIQKSTNKEEIENLNRLIELRELDISKRKEELYKLSEQYRKLFTEKLTNQRSKDLELLFKWQNKIIDSAKKLSGTKHDRYTVQFLFGIDDIEEVEVSLEFLNSLLHETTNTFEELAKKNPFAAIREAMEKLKSTELTEEMRKFYKDAIKDIRINLAVDISGGFTQLINSLSFLDDSFKEIANSINNIVNAVGTLSSSSTSWGQQFSSIFSIIATGAQLLYDNLVNADKKIQKINKEFELGLLYIQNGINNNNRALEIHKSLLNDTVNLQKKQAYWWDTITYDQNYSIQQLEVINNKLKQAEINTIKLHIAALEAARENTKKDKESAKYDKIIEELYEKLNVSTHDYTMTLIHLAEDIMGGSLLDNAEKFADILINSFKEGKNAAEDLRQGFGKMIEHMIKKTIMAEAIGRILKPLIDDIMDIYDKGGKLTEEDLRRYIGMANNMIPQMMDFFEGLKPFFEELNKWVGVGGEWDTLSKGIQGITEQTAGVIESYMNQVRFSIDELLANSNYFIVRFDSLVEVNSETLEMMRESVQIQKSIETILLNVNVNGGMSAFNVRVIN